MYHSAFIACYVDWWKKSKFSPDIILKLWGKMDYSNNFLRQLICHTGKITESVKSTYLQMI